MLQVLKFFSFSVSLGLSTLVFFTMTFYMLSSPTDSLTQLVRTLLPRASEEILAKLQARSPPISANLRRASEEAPARLRAPRAHAHRHRRVTLLRPPHLPPPSRTSTCTPACSAATVRTPSRRCSSSPSRRRRATPPRRCCSSRCSASRSRTSPRSSSSSSPSSPSPTRGSSSPRGSSPASCLAAGCTPPPTLEPQTRRGSPERPLTPPCAPCLPQPRPRSLRRHAGGV